MTCGRQCRYAGLGHTDAAKRISDMATQRWTDLFYGSVGKWMSFTLADGRSDGVLYDRKVDAVKHVPDEFRFMFIKLHIGGMSVCEAEIMLQMYRKAYDAGFRLTDPDSASGGPDIIPRIGHDKQSNLIRAIGK